jgi:catechol 2,3-dioxygenase-like lactoylglutathione lyase family enzyme
MSNFIQITPFITTGNLDRTVAFFTDILGFKALFHAADYAYLHRETAGIRLLADKAFIPPAEDSRFACYIDVRNLDQLYAELKPKLDTLPHGHVKGPKEQPWGQREIMVRTPDNLDVVFGQALDSDNAPPEPSS